jgi:hypothetical protein
MREGWYLVDVCREAMHKRDLDHRHTIIENHQRTLSDAKIILVLRRQEY